MKQHIQGTHKILENITPAATLPASNARDRERMKWKKPVRLKIFQARKGLITLLSCERMFFPRKRMTVF